MADQILISLKNVSRIYQMGENKIYALDNINLDIYKGEFLVVLGPSGSGKTTMLNMLGGMDRPTQGEIIFDKQNLTKASDKKLTLYRRNEIGFIFQFYNLLPTLTALENIEVATEIAQNPMSAKEALKLVELEDFAHHFPSQMSGGQQQRVAIARALASNPKLLLCDEPTGALDSKTGKTVLVLLAKLCKELHKNVIIISHNQKISLMANRVIKLHDGKTEEIIVQENPASADKITW